MKTRSYSAMWGDVPKRHQVRGFPALEVSVSQTQPSAMRLRISRSCSAIASLSSSSSVKLKSFAAPSRRGRGGTVHLAQLYGNMTGPIDR